MFKCNLKRSLVFKVITLIIIQAFVFTSTASAYPTLGSVEKGERYLRVIPAGKAATSQKIGRELGVTYFASAEDPTKPGEPVNMEIWEADPKNPKGIRQKTNHSLTCVENEHGYYLPTGSGGLVSPLPRASSLFQIGYQPVPGSVPPDITVKVTALTAAALVEQNLCGAAQGLNPVVPEQKKEIERIKVAADGLAKRLFEKVLEENKFILMVRVSEGWGRDEVAESFKANEVLIPKALRGETKRVKKAIKEGQSVYTSKAGVEYTIADAIIDVVEGTNASVDNVEGKPLAELKASESGGTSIAVIGIGADNPIRKLGNIPDAYTDGIFTIVPPNKKQEFIDNPLDPELTAKSPGEEIEGVLKRIADANGIKIADLEVVVMSRERESQREYFLKELQKKHRGLEITRIKDGTVAHSNLATFGRKEGKHKVVMTVGGAPEGAFNLAVAGMLSGEGAISSVRVYSKAVNQGSNKTTATDLNGRYAFTKKEREELKKLRPEDYQDILNGNQLFTQEDLVGKIMGAVSHITHNGVFGIEGTKKTDAGCYEVQVLRFGQVEGKPCQWMETVVVTPEELAAVDESASTLAQEAINDLIRIRDARYMKAVTSEELRKIIPVRHPDDLFIAGHDAYEVLKKHGKAMLALNVVSYNDILAHLLAAKAQNTAVILEVARSQLGYALDEKQVVDYIKEIAEFIDYKNPAIILHGDHIQYDEASFKQKDILKEEYEKVFGKGLFKDVDINTINDETVLGAVRNRLAENTRKERKAITDIVERLITAGFTSIAIDASTLFDEVAGDAVMDYYGQHGNEAEKLVVKLEEGFYLPLEWGQGFLKLNPADKKDVAKFNRIKEKVISDMKSRHKPAKEIKNKIKEMETAFGTLVKKAEEAKLTQESVIAAYDKIMEEVAKATIAGETSELVRDNMSEAQKALLLPSSNAAETAYQVKQMNLLVARHRPNLVDRLGIEVEVGHVDKKVPNPRLGGKLEAKMTHPLAVRIMGKHLKKQGLSFDLIATNNGSGHGTDFDKKTLTPVSQVGKISPFLTEELQAEAAEFGAAIAQHGTSGSDDPELRDIQKAGVIKFNIATIYQQIILNVLSLLDDGLKGKALVEKCQSDKDALIAGLHQRTRAKLMQMAGEITKDPTKAKIEEGDSLFEQFVKGTYAWGNKKKKIKDSSGSKDVATVFAKEFKRAFKEMDKALYLLGLGMEGKAKETLRNWTAVSELKVEFAQAVKDSRAVLIDSKLIEDNPLAALAILEAKEHFGDQLLLVLSMDEPEKIDTFYEAVRTGTSYTANLKGKFAKVVSSQETAKKVVDDIKTALNVKRIDVMTSSQKAADGFNNILNLTGSIIVVCELGNESTIARGELALWQVLNESLSNEDRARLFGSGAAKTGFFNFKSKKVGKDMQARAKTYRDWIASE